MAMVGDLGERCRKAFGVWMVPGRSLMVMVNSMDYVLTVVDVDLVGI